VQFSHFSVKELLTSDRLATFSHREQCQLDWGMSTAGLVQFLCRSWRWYDALRWSCCWPENASEEVKEARELHVAQPLSSWWLPSLIREVRGLDDRNRMNDALTFSQLLCRISSRF
jgi:hypothetical protein